MKEEKFYDVLTDFSKTGKVNAQNRIEFCLILEFFIERWPYFYEDADSNCTEEEQLSLYNIEKIKNGNELNLELSEYIADVVKELIENIASDDDECETNYKKDLGWI